MATIVVLPFNYLPYFESILKDVGCEAAFYPIVISLILGATAFLFGSRLHKIKDISYYILLLLLFWIILSGIVNFPKTSILEFKGRWGALRFFLQTLQVIFWLAVSVLIYNLARRRIITLRIFQRFIIISFIIAGAYSLIEIFMYQGAPWAIQLIETIAPYITKVNEKVFIIWRIRSLCQEPSLFAMYCSICLPWLLSSYFCSRRVWCLFLLLSYYLIILIIFSFSRTGYVIIPIQLLLFFIMVSFKGIRWQKKQVALFLVGALILANGLVYTLTKTIDKIAISDVVVSLVSSPDQYDTFGGSDISRRTLTATVFNIVLNYPIFGCGWGQFPLQMSHYVPAWGMESSEVSGWLNNSADYSAAPSSNMFARIAAEAGLPGLFLWLTFWLFLLARLWETNKKYYLLQRRYDWQGFSLLVSLIGIFLGGFKFDGLRFVGFWILLGLSWAYCDETWTDT